MSSGQSNYSDDSLPPPPAGLKMSPSPEPSNGNLQIDCDYDAQQDFAHEGFADVDSAFSDSMSLPSSGSHISVTTTSSGSSMGSGGITNSPTPVGISLVSSTYFGSRLQLDQYRQHVLSVHRSQNLAEGSVQVTLTVNVFAQCVDVIKPKTIALVDNILFVA